MARPSLVSLLLVVVALTAPRTAPAASVEPLLEHVTDRGAAISLGFDVAPLRPQVAPPPPVLPLDAELQSTAISFDLRLRWPGAELPRALEPYLVVGPALFVVEPDYVGRLLGTRVDPSLRLGAKAGAGVNWHIGKDATLFGAYEATSGGGLGPVGGKGSAADPVSGYDFTYGIRFRY